MSYDTLTLLVYNAIMQDSVTSNNPAKPIKPAKPAARNSIGIKILFAVLIAWSLLIAIGSFQGTGDINSFGARKATPELERIVSMNDVRRPIVVIATMSVFLGVWVLALRSKSRRD